MTHKAFHTFELERWQGRWENTVRNNLSESGVHALTFGEMLAETGLQAADVAGVSLGYSQTDGTEGLRTEIARLYPGSTAANVLVTVGSSEANFITSWTLMQRGARVTVQVPSYGQTLGLARNFGADLTTYSLIDAEAWAPDLEAAMRAIRPDTALVCVTDPNNPTGHVMSTEEREVILGRCREVGAVLAVDEVYRGAERVGTTLPTWWRPDERIVSVSGLSKAYGIPGLRLGWIVAPEDFIDMAVRRHDYAVIGPAAVSDFLAARALSVGRRLLDRTRRIIQENYQVLNGWLADHNETFAWTPPAAGAMCFIRFKDTRNTLEFVEQARTKHSLLLVPGEQFGLPGYLRIGFGGEKRALTAALQALHTALQDG